MSPEDRARIDAFCKERYGAGEARELSRMSLRSLRTVLVIGSILAAVLWTPFCAQEPEVKPVQWSVSGESRIRPEGRDNQDLNDDADDRSNQVFMRLRLGIEATIKEDFRIFLQAQDSRVWGEEASTASNEKNLDLHQGYVEARNLGDLESASGPWQDASGAILGFDPTGTSGDRVGEELDLTYRFDWRDKAKVEVGVSRFRPGEFAENTRGDDPSDWGYLQLTLGF
jgi:hypothetical protein